MLDHHLDPPRVDALSSSSSLPLPPRPRVDSLSPSSPLPLSLLLPFPPLTLPLLLLLLLLSLLSLPSPTTAAVFATWVSPASSPLPAARCHQLFTTFSSSSTSSSLFLFGGRASTGVVDALNDVWTASFNGNEVQWSQLTGSPTLPSARFAHTGTVTSQYVPLTSIYTPGQPATSAYEPVIWLFGGIDSAGRYLDDIWSYTPATATWAQVRVPSFARDPSLTGLNATIHTAQPTPRAWTAWRTVGVSMGALRALSGPLVTANLVAYLDLTFAVPSANRSTAFAMFGGRSDPPNIYSSIGVQGPVPAEWVGDGSVFNTDYADLWLYMVDVDVWVRVGNTSCANPLQQCTDYTSIANLSAGAVPALLTSLNTLATATVRPAQLLNRTLNMIASSSQLQSSLQSVLYTLYNTTAGENSAVSNCYDTCANPVEFPSPTISYLPSFQCTSAGGIISSSGAEFCNATATGIAISQLRPNSSEGHSTAVHTVSGDGASSTYLWQFGGFSCATSGQDVLSVSTWDSSCFSQALSVLDPSTLVWYTFSPPTSASTQILWWPSPRLYSSMAIDTSIGQIWVYGGACLVDGAWQFYSDLRLFDIGSLQWLETSVSGVAATASVGASLVFVPSPSSPSSQASGLFLFGGCLSSGLPSAQFLQLQTTSSITAANWLASGPALTTAVAGVPGVISITAESLSSNNSFTGQLAYAVALASYFQVTFSEINSEGTLVPLLSPSVTEVGGGLYTVNYTLDYGAQYQVDIHFQQSSTSTAVPIRGSPFSLTLLPSSYVAAHTMVVGSNYSQVEKNALASVTMQLVDAFGNPEVASAAPFSPTFSLYYQPYAIVAQASSSDHGTNSSSSGTALNSSSSSSSSSTGSAQASITYLPLPITTVDNGDGTYTLLYTAPDLSSYYLFVYVNAAAAYGSPYVVTGLDPLRLPSSIQTAFLVLSVTLGTLVLLVLIAIIIKREDRVVRAGSPLFLVLICIGVILCIASVPVYAYQSDITCRLFPFLLTTGYILALSALFTKSYRVLLLFVSANLTTVTLTDATMLFPVLVLVSLETVLNLCWLIADPLFLVQYDSSSVVPYHSCGGPHAVAFVSASVAFNGLIALWGVHIAIRIRNVPEAFNESKLMGAALYNLALMLLIAIPLTWTASNTQSSHEDFLIPSAAILWCCAVTVATTVAPKLYFVVNPPPASFFEAYAPQQGVMIKGVKGRQASTATTATGQGGPHALPRQGAGGVGDGGGGGLGSWEGVGVQASPAMAAMAMRGIPMVGLVGMKGVNTALSHHTTKRWKPAGLIDSGADGAAMAGRRDHVEIEIPSFDTGGGVGLSALPAREDTPGEGEGEGEGRGGGGEGEEERKEGPLNDSPSSKRQRPAPIVTSTFPTTGDGPSFSSHTPAPRLAPPAPNTSERSRIRRIDVDALSPPHRSTTNNTPHSRPTPPALPSSSSHDDLTYLPRLPPLLPPGPPLIASHTGSPGGRGGAGGTGAGVRGGMGVGGSPYWLGAAGGAGMYPTPLVLGGGRGSPAPGSGRVLEGHEGVEMR